VCAVIPIGNIASRDVHLEITVIGSTITWLHFTTDTAILGDLMFAYDISRWQLGALLALEVDEDDDGHYHEECHTRNTAHNGHQYGYALYR